jgi:RNA polymerase sigma-70 factor (ECF subfamily)
MSDLGWINALLSGARPEVMGALLRYFRDLDTAEEAFQEACLRAVRRWPQKWPAARSGRLADFRRPQCSA